MSDPIHAVYLKVKSEDGELLQWTVGQHYTYLGVDIEVAKIIADYDEPADVRVWAKKVGSERQFKIVTIPLTSVSHFLHAVPQE